MAIVRCGHLRFGPPWGGGLGFEGEEGLLVCIWSNPRVASVVFVKRVDAFLV